MDAAHQTACGGLSGWTAPSRQIAVEAQRVRDFVAAIGETNPIYLDKAAAQEAGYLAIPAPPTFGFILERLSAIDDNWLDHVDAPPSAMLHGEQSFEYLHPIYVGDIIAIDSRIVETGARAGGRLEYATMETILSNQYGQVCNRQRFTVIVKAAKKEEADDQGR